MNETINDNNAGYRVAAVVVSYCYPPGQLSDLLQQLVGQCQHVFWVDNSPVPLLPAKQLPANVSAIVNRANVGLARALNQGIKAALDARFDGVLLLDQDSRPTPSMLARLLTARQRLVRRRPESAPIAAVGAAVYDSRLQRTLPFIRYGRWGQEQRLLASEPVSVDMLITSGCLIDALALRAIGLMDATLFIDAVDLDWCLRAKAAGWELYGVPAARLDHRLGDHVRQVPLLGRQVFIHSPRRQYTIIRNQLWLLRRPYVPMAWKLRQFPKLIYRLAFFSLFVAPRWDNFLAIAQGIRHGMKNPENTIK